MKLMVFLFLYAIALTKAEKSSLYKHVLKNSDNHVELVKQFQDCSLTGRHDTFEGNDINIGFQKAIDSRNPQVIITWQIAVSVPQPVPVSINCNVPVPVNVPVRVNVDSPYPVQVPRPYSVPVERYVPYIVYRDVLIPVHVPIKVAVPSQVPVTYNKPYPVPVTKPVANPVSEPVIVKKPVPIYINTGGSNGSHERFSGSHISNPKSSSIKNGHFH